MSTSLNLGQGNVRPKSVKIAASASGANEVVAAVTGKRIVVLSYAFSGAGAVNAKWQSAANDLTGLTYIAAAGGGQVVPFSPMGWVQTNVGEALNLNLSAAVAVGGVLTYIETN